MTERKLGCLRPALFGCLGILGVVVIGLAVASVVAWNGVRKEQVEDHDRSSDQAVIAPALEAAGELPAGRVILELSHGEFYLRPGEPGDGVRVTARFDQRSYELVDDLEVLPDSTWVYRVRYRRTIPALQALLQMAFGGSGDSRVDVYLPPDAPVALELQISKGAGEAKLGGLWLTDVDIDAGQGGFSLRVGDPLRQPVNRFVVRGRMGGLDVSGLGNASPRLLEVAWRMGGANVSLDGDWVRSCDASLSVDMGGMSVVIPHGVTVETLSDDPATLESPDEVTTPVIRLRTSQKRGEIDVVRH
jgi:hypothetical protein